MLQMWLARWLSEIKVTHQRSWYPNEATHITSSGAEVHLVVPVTGVLRVRSRPDPGVEVLAAE